jgi:Fe-S-cluster containining protein
MSAPALRRGFVLARPTPFAYECRACSRCCRGKVIHVNPYEVARLAEALATSTTDVLARFTTDGGSTLAAREDGTCVFLGERGCTVHAARPLVCRLYPLGRRREPDGTERFAELEPHPQTAGVYGSDGAPGTVDDYVRAQDVERHIAAADRYLDVLKRMMAALARRQLTEEESDLATQAMNRAPAPADENLLDLDAFVARWCAANGREVPRDVEARTALHLRALEEYAGAPGDAGARSAEGEP